MFVQRAFRVRFFALHIFMLLFLARTPCLSAEFSQMVPTQVPIPMSENLLRGDVLRVVVTMELPTEDAALRGTNRTQDSASLEWKKVDLSDLESPPEVHFLVPQNGLFDISKPYFAIATHSEEKRICFFTPLITRESLDVLTNFLVTTYDYRGRIHDLTSINPCDLLFASSDFSAAQLSSFRYSFSYNDSEKDNVSEVVLYLRPAGRKKYRDEYEIGRIQAFYENGRLARFLADGDKYFFSKSTTKLTYNADGFLASKEETDENDQLVLHGSMSYRNYEKDDHGNWTRRDIYRRDHLGNEQFQGTQKRVIEYNIPVLL